MTIQQAITQLITDAFYKAKRRTRSKWKRHARPHTVKELRALPYQEYLRTEHWRRIRLDALAHADYECQACEIDGVELQVHHLDYKRLGREKPRDLRVLCAECHAKIHEGAKDGG